MTYRVIPSEKVRTPAAEYPLFTGNREDAFDFAEENADDYHYGLEVIDEFGKAQ